MSYLYNESRPFLPSAGYMGKNKAVLLTNTTTGQLTASLYTYNASGTTANPLLVSLMGSESKIFDIRVWGVSAASGVTGSVLA